MDTKVEMVLPLSGLISMQVWIDLAYSLVVEFNVPGMRKKNKR